MESPLHPTQLTKRQRFALYEKAQSDRSIYHRVSCCPITKAAEDDMELLSDIFTWGEEFVNLWEVGCYVCSRCRRKLYESFDKWSGPCVWPSFRRPVSNCSVKQIEVYPYNNYVVAVCEIYCGGCDLFIG